MPITCAGTFVRCAYKHLSVSHVHISLETEVPCVRFFRSTLPPNLRCILSPKVIISGMFDLPSRLQILFFHILHKIMSCPHLLI